MSQRNSPPASTRRRRARLDAFDAMITAAGAPAKADGSRYTEAEQRAAAMTIGTAALRRYGWTLLVKIEGADLDAAWQLVVSRIRNHWSWKATLSQKHYRRKGGARTLLDECWAFFDKQELELRWKARNALDKLAAYMQTPEALRYATRGDFEPVLRCINKGTFSRAVEGGPKTKMAYRRMAMGLDAEYGLEREPIQVERICNKLQAAGIISKTDTKTFIPAACWYCGEFIAEESPKCWTHASVSEDGELVPGSRRCAECAECDGSKQEEDSEPCGCSRRKASLDHDTNRYPALNEATIFDNDPGDDYRKFLDSYQGAPPADAYPEPPPGGVTSPVCGAHRASNTGMVPGPDGYCDEAATLRAKADAIWDGNADDYEGWSPRERQFERQYIAHLRECRHQDFEPDTLRELFPEVREFWERQERRKLNEGLRMDGPGPLDRTALSYEELLRAMTA